MNFAAMMFAGQMIVSPLMVSAMEPVESNTYSFGSPMTRATASRNMALHQKSGIQNIVFDDFMKTDTNGFYTHSSSNNVGNRIYEVLSTETVALRSLENEIEHKDHGLQTLYDLQNLQKAQKHRISLISALSDEIGMNDVF